MWHQRDLRGREGQRCVSRCSALIAFMQTSQSTWLLCQPQCPKLKGGGGGDFILVEPIFAFYSPRLWLMVWSCFKHAEFCTAIHCSLGLTSWNWNLKSSWTLNSSQVCPVTSDGKMTNWFFLFFIISYTLEILKMWSHLCEKQQGTPNFALTPPTSLKPTWCTFLSSV